MPATPEEQFIELFDLWPQDNLGPTFLTTYELDPAFFEGVLLPQLRQRGAFPLVVVADLLNGYEPTFICSKRIHGPNCDYHLVPFDAAPARFHPKVHLFAKLNAAVVGSGNLTPGGAGFNLEIFDRLTAEQDGAAVAGVRAFFRDVLSSQRVSMRSAQRNELLRLIPATKDPKPTGETKFVHSVGSPLLTQLKGRLSPEGGRSGRFFAPFHDADHRTSRRLAEELGLTSLEVAAPLGDEPPAAKKPIKSGVADVDRYLHAKMLWARGKDSATLLVGSANLTYPAWSGGNVEAVVWRESYTPSDFNGLIESVEFVPKAWAGIADHEPEKPEKPAAGPKRLPLIGAELLARQLRISIGPGMPASAKYWLEDRARLLELAPNPGGQGELIATLTELPWRAFVVRATAKGFEDARVWVHRPEQTAATPRARAIAAALEIGATDNGAIRHDLLTCVLDLFARLHAHAKVLVRPNEPPPAKSSGADAAEKEDVVEEGQEWMQQVEEIILERRFNLGGISGAGARLTQALSVALGLGAPGSGTVSGAALLGLDDEIDAPEEDAKAAKATLSASGTASNRSAKAQEEWEQLARGTIDKVHGGLRLMIEGARRPEAVVVYEVLLQLLENVARSSDDLREEALRRALLVINEAFGTIAWPETGPGWATPEAECPDEVGSLVSLLRAAHQLQAQFSDHDSVELDDAHRCLVALKARKGRAAEMLEGAALPAGALPLSVPLQATARELLERLPATEEARRILEPVWEYDRALREWASSSQKLEVAAAAVQECRKGLASSHRSAGFKHATDDLPGLELTLAAATAAETAAREAMAKAKARLIAAPKPRGFPEDLRIWLERMHRSRSGKTFVARLERGVCTNCHRQAPANLEAVLGDPRELRQCACGALVSGGSRRPSDG